MNKTIVIYHKSDFDGIFCREIARRFLPDAELIGWEYGESTPEVPDDAWLYILDLSVPELMMHPRLIWIDHHKSAIDKYDLGLNGGERFLTQKPIAGLRIDGVGACRLAWQWFNISQHNAWNSTNEALQVPLPVKQDFIDRTVSEPYAVRLAGEYDIWDKRDPDAELFQHGLRSRELTELTWHSLLDTECDTQLKGTGMELSNSEAICRTLLQAGYSLHYAQTKQNESIIKEMGFNLDWEGLVFLACNHARYNSLLFTAGLRPEHDACFGFKWTGKDWSVSLYHAPGKEHHDLSQIAVKYGGGGHRGACGFRADELPFLQ